jgi:hypothetical protein
MGLMLAAALSLRADVFVLKNGSLLLGQKTASTAESVSVSVGVAGAVSVRLNDIRQTIACPSEDEPDSYLKAARRAERAGWFVEAFACCEKSIAVEPVTAVAAQALRAALQQRALAGARANVKAAAGLGGDLERQRMEAQRMIAEGEQTLRAAQLAAGYDARNRGASAQRLQQQGAASVEAAEAKIEEGKAILAKVEKAMAPPPPPPPPPPPSTAEQITQWAWLAGIGLVGLAVAWFLLSPFISRR